MTGICGPLRVYDTFAATPFVTLRPTHGVNKDLTWHLQREPMSVGDNSMTSQTPLQWANQLGLAATTLFGTANDMSAGMHYALLDGRRSSFVCSESDSLNVQDELSRSWRWSADLVHHVIVTPDQIGVRSGRADTYRRFHRKSVE